MVSHIIPNSTAAESRVVLDAIRRIVQALRVSSRAAEQDLTMSGAQLFVLQTLGRQGAWSLNDLAERTATHQSSVSVVVDKLVERKLVRRAPAKSDRRRIELSITASGRALLGKAPEAAQERLIRGLQTLSSVDRKALARTLSKLADATRLSDEHPVLFFEDGAPDRRPKAKRRARGGQS